MSRKVAVIVGMFCSVMCLVYFPFFHYSEPTQVGITRNWITGDVRLDTSGWNVTPPWVSVAKIDKRPMRVCVTTAGRGFNCKLVQFEPNAFKEFIAVEGFYYYWWANRVSFNFGYNEEYRGMNDLLRGYAYGIKKYPFITIVRDYVE